MQLCKLWLENGTRMKGCVGLRTHPIDSRPGYDFKESWKIVFKLEIKIPKPKCYEWNVHS